jgi:hypothetical protein
MYYVFVLIALLYKLMAATEKYVKKSPQTSVANLHRHYFAQNDCVPANVVAIRGGLEYCFLPIRMK